MDLCKDKLEYSDLFIQNIKFEKNYKYDIKYSVLNIDNAIKVSYQVSEPLYFIFDNSMYEKYDNIFKFMLKMNILEGVLSRAFTHLKVDKRNSVKLNKVILRIEEYLRS